MKKQKALSLAINAVLAGSLLMGATAAMAYQPGDFIVRAGAANVDPDDDSDALKLNGTVLSGTEAEVDDDTQLGITFTYMLNEHWGLGLLAATPFEHDIKADLSGIGAGKPDAGSTKHLPPTLTLQYFPMASDSKFQPYIGAGINYTNFFEEDLDSELETTLGSKGSLELDDSWGFAFQAGMDYQLNEHWLLNASIWYLDIDTEAKIKLDAGPVIKTDVDIDPWVYMVGIGYKF